jgi:quinohemoprotein ethanol dehydrogenase
MAFSPKTGLAYFQASQTFMGYAAADSYDKEKATGIGMSFGGYDAERRKIADYADANTRAWLTAWNPATQKEAWRVPYPLNGSGGVLATAGNLVFQGTIGMTLAAYQAATGKKLWEAPAQNVPIAAPITYTIDGEQYVAINTGWGGGLAHVERSKYSALNLSKPRLLVFKLGGKAELPPPGPAREVPELLPPPPGTGSVAAIAKGEQLYGANCSLCHGTAARGGIKDLRHMSPARHKEFLDVVLGGKLAANGMASFADILSKEEAEAVHHYLIARANADWDNDAAAAKTQ